LVAWQQREIFDACLQLWLAISGEYVNTYKQYINERGKALIYAASSTDYTRLIHKFSGKKMSFKQRKQICLYLISITVLALAQRKQYLECG